MAKKPQNRLELRRQYEAAEDPDPMEEEVVADEGGDDDDEAERKPKKKKAPAKPKAKAVKAVKPAARMRVVWGVVNDAFKTVATFEFSQKEAAQAKADEMTAKGKGSYFLQKVKEAMPDDAPGLGAVVPRVTAATSPALIPKPEGEDDVEEPEDDDDDDADDEEDMGSDDED